MTILPAIFLVAFLWHAPWTAATAAAADSCGSERLGQLCVHINESALPEATSLITGLVSRVACSSRGDDSKDNEVQPTGRKLTVQVGAGALGEILRELDRRRVSYAFARNAKDDEAYGCEYQLIAVGSGAPVATMPSPDDASRSRARPVAPRSPARPAGVEFPTVAYDYLSMEDALPDVRLLDEHFDAMSSEDKKEALDVMQTLYQDWQLDEARRFIEEVARGGRRYNVDPSVNEHAMRITLSID
jgi:hypothetical protein